MQRLHDSSWNVGKWQDPVHRAQLNGCLRHAVYHTAQLILGDCDGTRVLEALHPLCSIAAHAGEKHSNSIAPRQCRSTIKHNVNRGTRVMKRRALIEPYAVAAAFHNKGHMVVPWRYERPPLPNLVAIDSFPHFEWATLG